MKENGKKMIDMEKEYLLLLLMIYMMGIGNSIKEKVMEFRNMKIMKNM